MKWLLLIPLCILPGCGPSASDIRYKKFMDKADERAEKRLAAEVISSQVNRYQLVKGQLLDSATGTLYEPGPLNTWNPILVIPVKPYFTNTLDVQPVK